MMTRRFLLAGATALLSALGLKRAGAAQAAEHFAVTHSDAEWKALLPEPRYAILRGHGTEHPGSSPLNAVKSSGLFHCAGCDLPVYSSKMKYESGTGWPSFWDSLPDAVGTQDDISFGMIRTEVHCRRCGGHFGHIFDDGPKPTGKRHCLNGLALTFESGPV